MKRANTSDPALNMDYGTTSKSAAKSVSTKKWPCPLCEHPCASEGAARWHCLEKRATGQGSGKNKYSAKHDERDGIIFASKKEKRRYDDLKLLEAAGKIHKLELQPRFDCVVKGANVCTYVADFRYIDDSGFDVVEDTKGFKTPVYRLKKKLVEALFFPLRIQEI